MTTSDDQKHNPLHGVTLERMLQELVDHFGWETMAQRIKVAVSPVIRVLLRA
jgi:uncharacterized protein (DUF2132 family)